MPDTGLRRAHTACSRSHTGPALGTEEPQARRHTSCQGWVCGRRGCSRLRTRAASAEAQSANTNGTDRGPSQKNPLFRRPAVSLRPEKVPSRGCGAGASVRWLQTRGGSRLVCRVQVPGGRQTCGTEAGLCPSSGELGKHSEDVAHTQPRNARNSGICGNTEDPETIVLSESEVRPGEPRMA